MAAGQYVRPSFNRLTAISYPNFTYGAASQRNPSLVGNVVGRITHITDGAGTEDRLYGPLGESPRRLRAIRRHAAGLRHEIQYDTWNRMQRLTYPDDACQRVGQIEVL